MIEYRKHEGVEYTIEYWPHSPFILTIVHPWFERFEFHSRFKAVVEIGRQVYRVRHYVKNMTFALHYGAAPMGDG